MARRRHHYRRVDKEPPEFEITTFLNLMVVLVPFLLITAVFSRIAILELNLPENAASSSQSNVKPLEIIVRADKLQVDYGRKIMTNIPKTESGYDFEKLSRLLKTIKDRDPKKEDAMILMEPDLDYDYLILTMDATRSVSFKRNEDDEAQIMVLFPKISIGDAYNK